VTPPNTAALDQGAASGPLGSAWGILMALAAFALVMGLVTPVPERRRQRINRRP
jgi:hypothetical protein